MQISIRSMSIANNLKMATSQQKMRSLSLLGMWGVLCLSLLGITPRGILAADTVITGAAVVTADGSVNSGWAVIVGPTGQIKALVPNEEVSEAFEGSSFNAPEGSVLTPGLHDLMGALGTRGQAASLQAGTELFDPDLDASQAFDPTDPWLDVAAQQGVLYTTLAAMPLGVVNGKSATFLCQTAKTPLRLGEGKQTMALGDSVLSGNRMPTSRTALISLWRDWVASDPEELKSAGLLYVYEGIDLRQALSLPWSVVPVFIHTGGDARSPLDLVSGLPGPVHMVVGPLLEGGDASHLSMAVQAASKGIELSFAGGLPAGPADHLRTSAAIAVAAGMNPEAARRALFSNPATVAAATGTGVIEAGARADLVLFSGDPLDPASKVIHLWRGGEGQRVAGTSQVGELDTFRR